MSFTEWSDSVVFHLATGLLGPLLLKQGRLVRRQVLRLPEAAGERSGVVNSSHSSAAPDRLMGQQNLGPRLRLMVLGDSSAAGVGALSQEDALVGRLAAELNDLFGLAVDWKVVAKSGLDTRQVRALIEGSRLIGTEEASLKSRCDVMIIASGVNDVTARRSPQVWLDDLEALVKLVTQHYQPGVIVLSGLPPMHCFPALPQPLRWYMGHHARRLDRALQRWVRAQSAVQTQTRVQAANAADRSNMPREDPLLLYQAIAAPPGDSPQSYVAEDGFHPNALGYQIWAAGIAQTIFANCRWWLQQDLCVEAMSTHKPEDGE